MKIIFNKKKMKQGSMSTALVALVVAGVVALNMVCTTLTDRYSLKLDITAGQKYTISNETKTMLAGLKEPISVTVLMDKDSFQTEDYYSDVSKILTKYESSGGKNVKVQYIDPYKNPSVVNKYNETQTVTNGSIVVERGDKFKVLSLNDFFSSTTDQQSGQTYATGFKAEQALTTAVLTVTNSELPQAYIVTGHNEAISQSFQTMLQDSSYEVTTLNLMEKSIPAKANVLLISAPQSDFNEDELNKVDAFIKSGGTVLYFGGTTTPVLPNLESYLAEWGIKLVDQMLMDSERNVGHPTQIAPLIADADINKPLESKSDMVLLTPQSKPLEILFETKTGRNTTPVLTTAATAYAKDISKLTDNQSYDKAAGDAAGPFTVAALAQYTGGEKTGNLFVSGSTMLMADDLMSASSLLNKSFLTSVISYTTPDVKTVSIAEKSLSGEPMTIMGTATMVVFWVIIVLFPLLIIAAGIVIFIKRRHL